MRVAVLISSVVAAARITDGPITKVVNLLKEIKAGIAADGSAEQQVYDKFACWCEKTTSRKAQAIESGKEQIQALGTSVLTLKGKAATLASEIAQLGRDIAENEEAQKAATAIREKENASYQTETSELQQTIGALEKAVNVLTGAGTKTSLLSVRSRVEKAARVHLPKSKAALITAFLKNFYDEKAQASQAYSPQSATIIGILKDMYTTFVQDLEAQTKDETSAQGAFEGLMEEKKSELETLNRQLTKKEGQKAEAEKMLADTAQQLEDTQLTLHSDTEFFDATADECKAKADDWSERSRLRTEELDSINRALEILDNDDAHALFNKAIKPGQEFTQVNAVAGAPRLQAFAALKKAAKASHSLRLASLAAQLRGSGHFDVVIKEIETMMGVLDREAAQDIEQRDWCKDTTHAKTEEKKNLDWEVKKAAAKIEKLETHKAKLDEHIAETANEIEATNTQIADMTAEREAQHSAFLQAKADDEQAIDLIARATEALTAYYKNNAVDQGKLEDTRHTLLQQPEFAVSEDQAPEAKFSDKGKHSGSSKGVVSLLTMIKEDLQREVKNGVDSEKASQTSFEKAKASAEELVRTLTDKKTNLESERADTDAKITSTTEYKASKSDESTGVQTELDEMKPNCDWILGAFEKRADHRKAEREGLEQAKSILSGASLGLVSVDAKERAFLADNFDHMTTGFLARRR